MNQSDLNNESIKLLAKIYTWRKKLIIVSVIAAILSTIIAFLMAAKLSADSIRGFKVFISIICSVFIVVLFLDACKKNNAENEYRYLACWVPPIPR